MSKQEAQAIVLKALSKRLAGEITQSELVKEIDRAYLGWTGGAA